MSEIAGDGNRELPDVRAVLAGAGNRSVLVGAVLAGAVVVRAGNRPIRAARGVVGARRRGARGSGCRVHREPRCGPRVV